MTKRKKKIPLRIHLGLKQFEIDPKAIHPALEKLFSGNWKKGGIPHLREGQAAERIVKCILNLH